MQLNLKKCAFSVKAGRILRFMLTEQGIETSPTKFREIIDMKSSTNVKDIQALNNKLVALTRFISRSTDNFTPFFHTLKNNKAFKWTNKCEESFKKLKVYLATSPILT